MNTTEPLTPVRNNTTAWTLIFGAWLVASVATLGALFFGEVMELPPCVLCWYQRIFMFHLLLIARVIPESIKPCTQGVPCSQTVIEWFGFVTIPLLSVLAFLTILALLVAAHFRSSK